jgi:hypothetical protein
MILTIFQTLVLFIALITLLQLPVEVAYNLKNSKRTLAASWVVPALLLALFFFLLKL